MLSFDVAFALYMALLAVLTLWMGLAESWLACGLLVIVLVVGIPWLSALLPP
jgi:hypothetical protein